MTKTTRKQLPRTHCRGGQSQNRIARLRDEAIHNYLVKLNEKCVELFIDPKTSLPRIKGLVIMGAGNKKMKLQDVLDPRIKGIILEIVTTEYLDATIASQIVDNAIQHKNQTIVSSVLKNEAKLEYGHQEVIQLLDDGMLEIIIVTTPKKEEIDQLEFRCLQVGCQLHIIDDYQVSQMGGIIAQKWY